MSTDRRTRVNSRVRPSRLTVRVREVPSSPAIMAWGATSGEAATPSTATMTSPGWIPASRAGELGRTDRMR